MDVVVFIVAICVLLINAQVSMINYRVREIYNLLFDVERAISMPPITNKLKCSICNRTINPNEYKTLKLVDSNGGTWYSLDLCAKCEKDFHKYIKNKIFKAEDK